MEKSKLKIYLAEDHHVVRKGMQRLISSFNSVGLVKDAANGKELMCLIREEIPDAVILDIEMPVMGGVETARIIADHYPTVKMLVLTMHNEAVFIQKLSDLGVHGILNKAAEPQEVERALTAIIENDFYLNEIACNAHCSNNRKTEEQRYSKLTNREIEVLLLICQELTPGEISERLHISEKTFFNHRSNILEKTGCRSNVGLVSYAVRNGYFKIL